MLKVAPNLPGMCISFVQFSICDHFFCSVLMWSIWIPYYFCVPVNDFSSVMWSVLFLFCTVYHFNNLSHYVFVLFCFFLLSSLLPPAHTHMQFSNGFDHYSPANSPYLHSDGGSLGSGTGTAFPFFPPSSSSSSSTSSSCPTRSWSRPTSALLPDYTHYCTLGSPMVPSSRVPTWKVCSSPRPWW